MIYGLKLKNSDIEISIDEKTNTAYVTKAGFFVPERIRRIIDHFPNKYRNGFEWFLKNFPTGYLPVGTELGNHCFAGALISTSNSNRYSCNGNDEFKNYNGISYGKLVGKIKNNSTFIKRLDFLKNNAPTTRVKRETYYRIHQGIFRKAILQEYSKCIFTGVEIKQALEAAHLMPWKEFPLYRLEIKNGILLCRSLHSIFDNGYISINPNNGEIVFSSKLSNKDILDIEKMGLKQNTYIDQTILNNKKYYIQYHFDHIYVK